MERGYSRRPGSLGRGSLGGNRLQVADKADHVLGDDAANGAGGVGGRPHGSVRGENETGRLQEMPARD